MKRFLIFILLLLCINTVHADQDFNSWLENYAFDAEDETSREELLEIWNEKSTEKLNLNTATREELEEFSFLSSKQITSLILLLRSSDNRSKAVFHVYCSTQKP